MLHGKMVILQKKEGDKKTPKGIFGLQNLYYRKDKVKPNTSLRCIQIKKIWDGVTILIILLNIIN